MVTIYRHCRMSVSGVMLCCQDVMSTRLMKLLSLDCKVGQTTERPQNCQSMTQQQQAPTAMYMESHSDSTPHNWLERPPDSIQAIHKWRRLAVMIRSIISSCAAEIGCIADCSYNTVQSVAPLFTGMSAVFCCWTPNMYCLVV